MLKINGKVFMNLQEAVQWLLDNNALPFQSSANYVANTEIGLGTIVNPSPAKVRIGSLIFFADSKVSTVIGLTENGFMVSDQYNDLVDDVVYVSNVALNASGHLIVSLSNGTDIDAGLIKQVTGFSIDGSQHLIVSYNDGTSTDLGAIFNGNVTISGNLTVTGNIIGATQLENIQDANGNKRFIEGDVTASVAGVTITYGKWSLSGTHLMIVLAGTITSGSSFAGYSAITNISVPLWVKQKIYPTFASIVCVSPTEFYGSDWSKETNPMRTGLSISPDQTVLSITNVGSGYTVTADRNFRMAFDLLIDNA